MSVLRHEPGAVELEPGAWRPTCGCGKRFRTIEKTEANARKVAEKHAAMQGCGKQRLTEREAEGALLRAKIARGVHGRARRREQRAYLCPDCPGDVWHLTSHA